MKAMMASAGVSVVLPIHRAEPDLFRAAVASICRQTCRELDILLVVNGGDSATLRLAAEAARGDGRIRVVERESAGLAGALNEGLRMARHELVARMDGDDTCEPERLAKQAAFMEGNPEIVGVGTAFDGLDEAGRVLGVERPPTEPEEIQWRLCLGNVFCHGSMMLRRAEVLAAGGYDEGLEYAQDYELWLRLSRRRRLANLPEVLYRYRAAVSRRHEEQAAAAAGAMMEHWGRLTEPDEGTRRRIADCVSSATWSGRKARRSLASLEELLCRRGPTREGLLAWQWVAQRAGELGDAKLEALRAAGRRLVSAGARNVWLYGAGRHTAWLMENDDVLGVRIAGVADDAMAGAERFGMAVVQPEEVPSEADVLISSDAHEERMWERSLPMRARGVRVWRIYGFEQEPAEASSRS